MSEPVGGDAVSGIDGLDPLDRVERVEQGRTGMRPLATSSAPARRSADTNGIAQRFSYNTIAAAVPGSIAAAASSRSS